MCHTYQCMDENEGKNDKHRPNSIFFIIYLFHISVHIFLFIAIHAE